MKSRRKDKTERKNSLEEPPSQPWGSYAEEIVPLPLVGRRPETDSGWLGCDAGEYSGETGENCEAGVRSTCEPVEKDAFLKKNNFTKLINFNQI